MRLTRVEQEVILRCIKIHDSEADVRLFGSRVDDEKRGGDIDLLVISKKITFANKIDILVAIKNEIGDQKIDLCIFKPDANDPFLEHILPKSVRME